MNGLNLNTVEEGTIFIGDDKLTYMKRRLNGRLITANDASYDSARRVWNGLIDKRPGIIIRCRETADAISAVKFARDHGLRISVRGGGHNVAGSCLEDNGFVIDLSGMRRVRVDPQNRTVRADGGARLGDLDHETQTAGLAVPLGIVSATGVSGLTLHGGFGWLLRKHGLSIDNLLSADIVSADGQLRRADINENSDLFWAIRGGGGNFGVVTSFEFKTHPVGPQVWLSAPIYALEHAAEVMQAFREYMEQAPDDLMGLATYWSAPEVPKVPEKHHGSPVVVLLSCYTGPFEKGEKAIAPLRTIGTPIADLSGPMRFEDVQKFLDSDYPEGKFYYWKSIYLDRLDANVFQVLSEQTASRPSALSSIDVWTLGRAMSQVKNQDTAFYKRDAPYMIGIEANWDNRADTEVNIQWTRKVYEDLKRFTRGGDYLNFPGFIEDQESLLQGAYGPNLIRLKSIKAKYDPTNLFSGAINIRPI
jgi:FAD/FMN-containing dehydrogenase